MFMQHIALVPEAGKLRASEVARASAAIQKQVMRDFAPLWGVPASVDFFPMLEDVPFDYWPIIIGRPTLLGPGGVRREGNGQPYAHIPLTRTWTLSASRACLEMLANPYGTRTVTVSSPRKSQGSVAILLEVCAPCAGLANAYLVNEVLVSDFCTPTYFQAQRPRSGQSYSMADSLIAPLHVAAGGHLTWYEPSSGNWWLRKNWDDSAEDTNLGRPKGGLGGLRELVSALEPESPPVRTFDARAMQERAGFGQQRALAWARQRSARLNALLQADTGLEDEEASRTAPTSEASEERAEVSAERAHDVAVEGNGLDDVEARGAWGHLAGAALELVVEPVRRHEPPTIEGRLESLNPRAKKTVKDSTPASPRTKAQTFHQKITTLTGDDFFLPPAWLTTKRARYVPVGLATIAAALGLFWLGQGIASSRAKRQRDVTHVAAVSPQARANATPAAQLPVAPIAAPVSAPAALAAVAASPPAPGAAPSAVGESLENTPAAVSASARAFKTRRHRAGRRVSSSEPSSSSDPVEALIETRE